MSKDVDNTLSSKQIIMVAFVSLLHDIKSKNVDVDFGWNRTRVVMNDAAKHKELLFKLKT